MKYNKIVLVTGMGGSSCVFLINHLKKNGFKIIAVDTNPYAVGFLYADIGYVVPVCTSPSYLSVIKSLCQKEKVSFLIPLIDEELAILKSLESDFLKIICPSIDFINITLDKYQLIKSLSGFVSWLPKTFIFSDVLSDGSFLQFPVIAKPRTGRGSKGVYVVNNKNDLKKIIKSQKDAQENYILQEKIEGDEYTVSVAVAPDNRLLSVVPKKIIEKKGITNIAVTKFNKKIIELCEKITYQLKPHNPYNVQLILKRDNQEPYIFEINPRFSTTVTLTVSAGVDEVIAPLDFYIEGDRYRYLKNDFKDNLVLVRSVHEEYMEMSMYNSKVLKVVHAE